MKIHCNFEVWSKENSTGAASVIGLPTRAETGDFGGSLWTICVQNWDKSRQLVRGNDEVKNRFTIRC